MKFALLFFLTLLLISPDASAGRIRKGFRALEIHNYFEARRLFEKSLKRETAAASYGLSIIYQRNDNPFHNLDSAYSNIVRAYAHYPALKPRAKLSYAEM